MWIALIQLLLMKVTATLWFALPILGKDDLFIKECIAFQRQFTFNETNAQRHKKMT